MKKKRSMKWRLAVNGIKKNGRLYLPYVLAGIGMVAITYILLELSECNLLNDMNAGLTLKLVLKLGVIVMGVFSVSMLFYTNSFLIKTRTREFGLYNILGMDKKNIAGILMAETVITGAVSIIGGMLLGLLLSGLAEAFLARLVEAEADYGLSIDFMSLAITAAFFVLIFFVVMVKNVISISRRNTIDLLKEDKLGEKPPKARYFLTLAGLGILGAAYYIAVTITAPREAMSLFFIAVILVIVATDILFVVGSVTMCRILQKKKKYYYKTGHFVSLSSMTFRMKRNGTGLAEICILSTMVMVMLASTSCLYFGKDSNLKERFPRDFINEVAFHSDSSAEHRMANEAEIKRVIDRVAADNGIEPLNRVEMEYKGYTCRLEDGKMYFLRDIEETEKNRDVLRDVFFVTLEDYNRYMGTNEVLSDNEAICCEYGDRYSYESLTYFGRTEPYQILKKTDSFYNVGSVSFSGLPRLVFVVNSLPQPDAEFLSQMKNGQNETIEDAFVFWDYNFDLSITGDIDRYAATELFYKAPDNYSAVYDDTEYLYWSTEDIFVNRDDIFAMYGGLFFIGIFLSIVFICALGLMIYYKQISEGYEDRSRFEIMQKVGMTGKDIRNSINSQMSSVFYIPLAVAVVHLGFAFPMIYRCLWLFDVTDMKPLLITSLISVAIFAVIYTIIYRFTSNAYYKLVK